MRSKILFAILFCTLIANEAGAQRLWDIPMSFHDYVTVGGDTSLNGLKRTIMDPNSLGKEVAAYWLAVLYGNTQKEYLLDSLRVYAKLNDRRYYWGTYIVYQVIRGYFGEEDAIAGMDTVIQFDNYLADKLEAVEWEAKAGHLEHFDIVRTAFSDPGHYLHDRAVDLLEEYGKDPRYAQECRDMLTGIIQDSTGYVEVETARRLLSKVDSSQSISLLKQRFMNSDGLLRIQLYLELNNYDKDGQPERAMWAIPREPVDSLREMYYPDETEIWYYPRLSARFLEPFFLKFVDDWLKSGEKPSVAGRVRTWFLKPFIPLRPAKTGSVSTMIDTLLSLENQCADYGWVDPQSFSNSLTSYLTNANTCLSGGDSVGACRQIQQFEQSVDKEYKDSTNSTPEFVTEVGWKFLYYNAQYIIDRLPKPPSGFMVKLVGSTGTRLTTGSLQYYEGSWKDATNNSDGTFMINSTAKTLSLKMTYKYGTQTKSNVAVGSDTAVFQTVNTQIQLKNSQGNLIDTGTVQYYAGAWRALGTTTNGVATKELLPNSYSFRMTYAYGSNDKAQDIGVNPTIVFQTVNAAVQLQDSHGNLMDQGTVQYYSGAWRDFGTTSNGITTKELLPNSYSFRMTYAYGSNDKQQNIGTNPTVVFQTMSAMVQLKNSQGNLIDTGTVQYYAGAWRNFGTTTGGVATEELLPNNYSFRMTYAFVSNDKAQDISTNSTVVFSTVLCTVTVSNSQSQPVNNVQASYYSGAWRQIGPTVNGQVTKELLPANLTFRITYGTSHQDKTQNLSTNNIVEFSTP